MSDYELTGKTIYVSNAEESSQVQKLLFSKGFSWHNSDDKIIRKTEYKMLAINEYDHGLQYNGNTEFECKDRCDFDIVTLTRHIRKIDHDEKKSKELKNTEKNLINNSKSWDSNQVKNLIGKYKTRIANKNCEFEHIENKLKIMEEILKYKKKEEKEKLFSEFGDSLRTKGYDSITMTNDFEKNNVNIEFNPNCPKSINDIIKDIAETYMESLE